MILPITRHLPRSGDISGGHNWGHATGTESTEASAPCTGCPLPIRNDPDPNGKSAEAGKPWIRAKEDRGLLNEMNPLLWKLCKHGSWRSVRNAGHFQRETIQPVIRDIAEETQILNYMWFLNMHRKLCGVAHEASPSSSTKKHRKSNDFNIVYGTLGAESELKL